MNLKLDVNRINVFETENFYEPYTGRRCGYGFKANYTAIQTKEEVVKIKFTISCREIQPNSPEVNVQVKAVCPPLGINHTYRLIAEDTFSDGAVAMGEAIVANVILRNLSDFNSALDGKV